MKKGLKSIVIIAIAITAHVIRVFCLSQIISKINFK